MGQVIHLVSEDAVDQAWHEYSREAAKLADNPKLLIDRAYNEQLTRLHARWQKLFLMQEAAG
jgi:hypothetical protein